VGRSGAESRADIHRDNAADLFISTPPGNSDRPPEPERVSPTGGEKNDRGTACYWRPVDGMKFDAVEPPGHEPELALELGRLRNLIGNSADPQLRGKLVRVPVPQNDARIALPHRMALRSAGRTQECPPRTRTRTRTAAFRAHRGPTHAPRCRPALGSRLPEGPAPANTLDPPLNFARGKNRLAQRSGPSSAQRFDPPLPVVPCFVALRYTVRRHIS
jgi:hypothetical protein